jgi:hypothetical protein
MTTPTQIDTSPVTRELTRLISKGTTSEQVLLAAAVWLLPDLDSRELSQVLQCAQAAAEKAATRNH